MMGLVDMNIIRDWRSIEVSRKAGYDMILTYTYNKPLTWEDVWHFYVYQDVFNEIKRDNNHLIYFWRKVMRHESSREKDRI
jgi:hypothetical protein